MKNEQCSAVRLCRLENCQGCRAFQIIQRTAPADGRIAEPIRDEELWGKTSEN